MQLHMANGKFATISDTTYEKRLVYIKKMNYICWNVAIWNYTVPIGKENISVKRKYTIHGKLEKNIDFVS